MNAESASYLSGKFVEVIVAPGYDTEALGILRKKKKLRIITYRGKPAREGSNFDVRRVIGGYLVQSVETPEVLNSDLKIVTKRAPPPPRLPRHQSVLS